MTWEHVHIRTNKQAREMMQALDKDAPTIGAFDTETSGLHIIHDRPFLFQFGWPGRTFLVDIQEQPDLSRQVIQAWHNEAQHLRKYLAHNVKFDMHMLTNIGLPYLGNNLSDTQFFIRYAHDALKEADGGPPLGLKEYCGQYIDPKAKLHERNIRQFQTGVAKELNAKLKQRFGKGWTLKRINTFFKDILHDVDDLTGADKDNYLAWLNEDVPECMRTRITGIAASSDVPYTLVPREIIIPYAHEDIRLVLLAFEKLEPVLIARDNYQAVILEENTIRPIYEMERVGFNTDKEYLLSSKQRMKEYIQRKRTQLQTLVQQEVSVGQHNVIKQLLNTRFNIPLITTRKEDLTRVATDLEHSGEAPDAVDFIKTIQELRTLEKWYATYILRFIRELQHDTRLYTTIHQVGAVSGRVTSDFQQFPRRGVLADDGTELFYPRRMVKKSDAPYKGIVYLDYSQIELRVQALYTILVGSPDTNLCRAYMPYNCLDKHGQPFDHTNPVHLKRTQEDWFLREAPETKWHPTDVHGATAKQAFDVTEDSPNWAAMRSLAKNINFAKNYGAQFNRIKQMFPRNTDEQNRKIDQAYYRAFPGVLGYHQYCYRIAQERSHATNLFGVKYYGVSGHNLKNMFIQGSAATLLKWKIAQLYAYHKAHNIQSPWQMQIHDELSWEWHEHDPPETFFAFKQIMEDWPDTIVPIEAGMAVTKTTWAEKKDVESLEEFNAV